MLDRLAGDLVVAGTYWAQTVSRMWTLCQRAAISSGGAPLPQPQRQRRMPQIMVYGSSVDDLSLGCGFARRGWGAPVWLS
jgi:hypothetical protein